MKKNEKEAAVIIAQIFLAGLALTFDATYEELVNIAEKALLVAKEKCGK